MATDIVVQKKEETSPMRMLELAVQSGDLEKVNVMMNFVERYEINQDKKAFKEAMVRFSLEAPRILKDTHVKFNTSKGVTEYDHASLGSVCEAIKPALAAVGISYGWTTPVDTPSLITVVCTLSYGLYSESTSMSAAPDDSGGKNPIQAKVSTKSYLERHTLTGITGMATNDQDDDGRGGKDEEHERVVTESCAIIEASETLDDVQANFARYFGIAEKQKDKGGMEHYIAARDRRKIALETVENERFQACFAEASTVEAFNKFIVPSMKDQPRLKTAALMEVKRRGYRWLDKAAGTFQEAAQ